MFVRREWNFLSVRIYFDCGANFLIIHVLQITLGRATKDKPIDVDLSLEGPAWKISRKQGE